MVLTEPVLTSFQCDLIYNFYNDFINYFNEEWDDRYVLYLLNQSLALQIKSEKLNESLKTEKIKLLNKSLILLEKFKDNVDRNMLLMY